MSAPHYDAKIRQLISAAEEVRLELLQLEKSRQGSTDEEYRRWLAAQIPEVNRRAMGIAGLLQTVREAAVAKLGRGAISAGKP